MAEFRYDEDHFLELLSKADTQEEVTAVERLWISAEEAQKIAALGDLRNNSVKMLGHIRSMMGHIDHLAASVGFENDPVIARLRAEAGRIHSALHDPIGVRPAHDPATPDPGSDGGIIEGATTRALAHGEVLDAPATSMSTDYADLADEYVKFFNGASVRSSHATKVSRLAETAWENRARYQLIGTPLGIPWWFIAGLHQMESTYNFQTHLHNGDPLTARTVNHPAGQPAVGNPPFTFEDSAADALKAKGFDAEEDWSLPRALYRFERYNGFGYRQFQIASPYLWGFSTIYEKGKYIRDHVFDPNAVTQQCGVAVLILELVQQGRLGVASAQFADVDPEDPGIPAPAPDTPPNLDDAAPASHPFEAFWRENLADTQHFEWRELLFKGTSNAVFGSNTDPPASFYPKVVPLVRTLDAIRETIGGRINLTSVYRSEQYNRDVGGVADSRHKQFDAADFHVIDAGHGNSGDWAGVAQRLRAQGLFNGGIGIYNTFVHVDTRGNRADWDER